jgi:hypothetical protein
MPSVEEGRGTSVGESRGVAIQQRQQEHTAQHCNPQPRHMLAQFFNTKSCETFSLKHASRCEKLKWMTKQMFLQDKQTVTTCGTLSWLQKKCYKTLCT